MLLLQIVATFSHIAHCSALGPQQQKGNLSRTMGPDALRFSDTRVC